MKERYKSIAFQGMLGAYSDLACRAAYPDLETVPCLSFDEAFRAVKEERADLAMIPVDNTLAGRVADVHFLMPNSGLHIIAEHFQPVHHCLLGSTWHQNRRTDRCVQPCSRLAAMSRFHQTT